jgi:hypothetical protein
MTVTADSVTKTRRCLAEASAAGKVETTWAFPAAAAPLLRLGLGPVPVDEIAWILFRRTWVEPRT